MTFQLWLDEFSGNFGLLLFPNPFFSIWIPQSTAAMPSRLCPSAHILVLFVGFGLGKARSTQLGLASALI
jgi:hypothetical protein